MSSPKHPICCLCALWNLLSNVITESVSTSILDWQVWVLRSNYSCDWSMQRVHHNTYTLFARHHSLSDTADTVDLYSVDGHLKHLPDHLTENGATFFELRELCIVVRVTSTGACMQLQRY